MEFMRTFEKQAGTAFLIVFFTSKNEAYYIPFSTLSGFWQRMLDGGKKSFSYNELDKSLLINIKNDFMLHYLEQLEIDLKNRYR